MSAPQEQPPRSLPNKGTALVLEILPAIFGLFGIGWIYSGRTTTGVLLLVSGLLLIWGGYGFVILGSTALAAVTFGSGSLSCCLVCVVPLLQVIAAVTSTLMLNNELSKL